MTTVHFVYPHGPQISAPHAIGREVGIRLRQHYEVVHHEWDSVERIRPAGDAVLLGHAHPSPWTIFRQSAALAGWKRVLLMAPFHHGDLSQVAFNDHALRHSDLFLAITGNYWFETVGDSPTAHWSPKMVHVDLAVNRSHFPPLKHGFNPPGKRRFLYIGNAHKGKNVPWLNSLAASLPDYKFSWVGLREGEFDALNHLGFQDFGTAAGQETVVQHDFMITVGQADANPTTILEAMAWGLIPVCTAQSGYRGFPGIVNVPLNDTETTVGILKELQEIPEQKLLHMQELNWKALVEHFNWERFVQQVIDAIESDESPPLAYASPLRRAQFCMAEVNSTVQHRSMRNALLYTAYRRFIGKNSILGRWLKQMRLKQAKRR